MSVLFPSVHLEIWLITNPPFRKMEGEKDVFETQKWEKRIAAYHDTLSIMAPILVSHNIDFAFLKKEILKK